MKIGLKLFAIALFYVLTPKCYSQNYTGQKIFKDKFPAESKDYSQDTYIKIDNTCIGCKDIIVAVEDVSLKKVVQHAYIKSGDEYNFEYIPVGIYVCKYMWTDSYGRKFFEKDEKYMKFGFNQYGGYVITMQKTSIGNLDQEDITESEFFD